MSGEWYDSVLLLIFIASIWTAGDICKKILIPPIIGELLVGILFGPSVANIVPFVDVSNESAFSSLGNIGIGLLIMHSGLHVNLEKIKAIGFKAVLVGIIGTIIPIIMGTIFFWILGLSFYPDAFVSGIIITPASVGVSMRVLISLNRLNTNFGQTILTGALTDDFFAIVLLVLIRTVIIRTPTFVATGIPLIGTILFISLSLILKFKVFDIYLRKFIKKFKNFTSQDNIHLILFFVFFVAYSTIGNLVGSFLLGSFLAGFTFTNINRSMLLWRKDIKPYMSWLIRLFFSVTIAFTIPIEILFEAEQFWKGFILAIICIISKLLSALHIKSNKFIVGWAIVSRGEFSFLIGKFALEEDIISEKTYSIIIWGLLISTFIGPIVFQYLVKKYKDVTDISKLEDSYQLIIEGNHHPGVIDEILNTIIFEGYDVRDVTLESDDETDYESIVIYRKDKKKINIEEINDLKKEILTTIDEDNVKIILTPIKICNNGFIKIHIMGNDINSLSKLIIQNILDNFNINLIKVSKNSIKNNNCLDLISTNQFCRDKIKLIKKNISDVISNVSNNFVIFVSLVENDPRNYYNDSLSESSELESSELNEFKIIFDPV